MIRSRPSDAPGRRTSVRASPAEGGRHLPGDERIASPVLASTLAVTIGARPEVVWPWLVQMGGGRAGWYSYDRLDNGGVPSAERIVPDLQDLAVGDLLPAWAGSSLGFVLLDLHPAHHLLVGVPTAHDEPAVTWCLSLEPTATGTRLLSRLRAGRIRMPLPGVRGLAVPPWLLRLAGPPGHYVMQRKQLLGIRDRAERAAANRRPPATR